MLKHDVTWEYNAIRSMSCKQIILSDTTITLNVILYLMKDLKLKPLNCMCCNCDTYNKTEHDKLLVLDIDSLLSHVVPACFGIY